LLLIFYVQAYSPAYFHVLGIVFLGLCLDVLNITPIGEHAFALIIVTWSLTGLMQRFVFYSTIQQLLIVGLACVGYEAILYVANASFGYPGLLVPMAGIAMLTMLCWPILLKVLLVRGESRRHYSRSL
jgi:rod shape-determining protein MreD